MYIRKSLDTRGLLFISLTMWQWLIGNIFCDFLGNGVARIISVIDEGRPSTSDLDEYPLPRVYF